MPWLQESKRLFAVALWGRKNNCSLSLVRDRNCWVINRLFSYKTNSLKIEFKDLFLEYVFVFIESSCLLIPFLRWTLAENTKMPSLARLCLLSNKVSLFLISGLMRLLKCQCVFLEQSLLSVLLRHGIFLGVLQAQKSRAHFFFCSTVGFVHVCVKCFLTNLPWKHLCCQSCRNSVSGPLFSAECENKKNPSPLLPPPEFFHDEENSKKYQQHVAWNGQVGSSTENILSQEGF